ncbi:origin recognition complex subunit 5 C-terminus-domain-containing protein, partial [Coprinopsis sp. MPI-PUGE-AT-0042]
MSKSAEPTEVFHLPGFEALVLEVSTLLSTDPPPFIFVHDGDGCEVTANVLHSLVAHLSSTSAEEPGSAEICCGFADVAATLSPRLLYESLVHTLVDFQPTWEDGCANWRAEEDLKWNENMDSFLQGLRVAHTHMLSKRGLRPTDELKFVLVLEGVDRLKDTMPELLVPLTRLRELTQLDLCVIFVSEVDWEAVKPPLGASPDPYFMNVSPRRKESRYIEPLPQMLISTFPAISQQNSTSPLYHPALRTLYAQYATMICDVCYLYTHDPLELRYIAAARWPGFVKPILDKHRSSQSSEAADTVFETLEPPSEEDRLRLIKLFTASFASAVEAIYPRLMSAADWAATNEPEDDLLTTTNRVPVTTTGTTSLVGVLEYLPRISKFILVASFLASTNPSKSDLRMFGRGLDDKKRKRRAAPSQGKTKGVTKVAQRLLGPSPFPLDRLLAILGALLEENDADDRLPADEFAIPGEYSDMEISRRGVHSSILELVSNRLMHRTTKPDQLDGPPMFKCAISYDMTLALAKELKIPLVDLLWE